MNGQETDWERRSQSFFPDCPRFKPNLNRAGHVSPDFALFCGQVNLFRKELLQLDPSVWFPPLRGSIRETDRHNWFIPFVPASWGRWCSVKYGVHFDFICPKSRGRLPERFRLAVGVENPFIAEHRGNFKRTVIARLGRGEDDDGYVLDVRPHRKLLEVDPIPFDCHAAETAIQCYDRLRPTIAIVADVIQAFRAKGAFAEQVSFPGDCS